LSRKSQAAKTFNRQDFQPPGLSSITTDIPAFRERRARARANSTARPDDLSHGAGDVVSTAAFRGCGAVPDARFKSMARN